MKEKVKLTLSVNGELLSKYRTYCKQEGLIISRQVEKMMEEQLKKKR
jgi:hypothetical protein